MAMLTQNGKPLSFSKPTVLPKDSATSEDLTEKTIAAALLIAKLDEVLHHLQTTTLKAQLAIRRLERNLHEIKKKAGL